MKKRYNPCGCIHYLERGITLIALVITIILLLILAGVALKIILDNNFVDKTQTAVDKYAEQQAKEKLNIAIMTYKILEYSGENEKTFEDTIKEIGGEIEHNEEEGIYKIKIDGYEFEVDDEDLTIKEENTKPVEPEKPEEKIKYTVTVEKGEGISNVTPTTQNVEEGKSIEITATVESGYTFEKWEITSGSGKIASSTSTSTTLTPTSNIIIKATAKITVITGLNNITGTENKTINGANPAYNNPIIPVGFKTLDTEDAKWESTDGKTVSNWNNGLVITDAENDGNEFVWVPVDGTNVTYTRWLGSKNNAQITSLTQLSDDSLPDGVTSWGQTEESQITKYGGFYIARYEAGIPTTLTTAINTATNTARNVTGKPLSKKNQVPWNFIDYTKSKANAESMYATSYVKSGLLTGKMNGTVMKWLENAGINVQENSISWGNYANAPVTGITQYSPHPNYGSSWTSVSSKTKPTSGSNSADYSWLLKTGHSDYTKRKNIYDLAGNLFEWINEVFTVNDFSYRVWIGGGGYGHDGMVYPAGFRNYNNVEATGSMTGFRVALYIK